MDLDLGAELKKIYDNQINVSISLCRDSGITVRLGDDTSGYRAEEVVGSLGEAILWFQEAIAYFYATSNYARSLPDKVRERARQRVFTAAGKLAGRPSPKSRQANPTG
jgi:hypothetical protein